MGENEVINSLGNIRYILFDLGLTEEQLATLVRAVDYEMDKWRGDTEDIIKKLEGAI